MASPLSPSRRQQQPPALSRSALRALDALVLGHLSLADALATSAARRLFPLVEREDLIQVAREALVRSAPRCRAGEPAAPYLRRCITGALQHHLRDRVRLVRISRREHEKGTCPLGHASLDAPAAGEHSLLDQLASPEPEWAGGSAADGLALERLVEQLPAAAPLQISPMAVWHREVRLATPRARKKALAALWLHDPPAAAARSGRLRLLAAIRHQPPLGQASAMRGQGLPECCGLNRKRS